jgi:hypothetical protein
MICMYAVRTSAAATSQDKRRPAETRRRKERAVARPRSPAGLRLQGGNPAKNQYQKKNNPQMDLQKIERGEHGGRAAIDFTPRRPAAADRGGWSAAQEGPAAERLKGAAAVGQTERASTQVIDIAQAVPLDGSVGRAREGSSSRPVDQWS